MVKTSEALSFAWDCLTGKRSPEEEIRAWVTDWLGDKFNADRREIKSIPIKVRCQHLLALGRSGCGKSSYLYQLMAEDIPECLARRRTMIYIDPVTGIDRVIEETFIADHPNVILIDMADPDSLPRLSLFETGLEREGIGGTSYMINTFVDICSGLIDQDMTANMKSLFTRCARVMERVPNHTLHDLLDLLKDPVQYITDLGFEPEEEVFEFFVSDVVGSPGKPAVYKDTVKYLRGRIQTFLGDPLVCRLLVNRNPTMKIGKVIESGAIILVATRKTHTGIEGCRLIGKFFKALVKRIVQERAGSGTGYSKPVMLYEDEFQNSLSAKGSDPILESMLDEDRKFGLSVNVATTRFGRLSTSTGDAVLTCTGTKVIGNTPARIGALLAPEMRVPGQEFSTLPNFQLYVKSGSKMETAVRIKTAEYPFKKIGPRKPDRKAIFRLRQSMNLRFGEGYVRKLREQEAGGEPVTFDERDQASIASGSSAIQDLDL